MKRTAIAVVAALLVPLASFAPSDVRAEDFSQSIAAQSGGKLDLELTHGDVVIETHDEERVRIDARASSGLLGRGVRFDIETNGKDVEIVGRGGSWFGGPVRVRVRVPVRYSVEVETSGGSVEIGALEGSVEVKTSGAPIVVDGARGDVELRTSGSRVEVANVVGNVEIHTSGAEVRVSEVVGDVEVETSGDAVRIYDVEGAVKGRTSGGRIEVRFSGDPEGELRTSGGPIVAEIPAGAGVDLEARTSGGRVKLESDLQIEIHGEIENDRVEGRVNGGGRDLSLRTSGANVSIRVR